MDDCACVNHVRLGHVALGTHELGFGNHLTVDTRASALYFHIPPNLTQNFNVQVKLIASCHGLLKARIVDSNEVEHGVLVRLLPIVLNERIPAACASASMISTPGITG